jgi:hypothetical protein
VIDYGEKTAKFCLGEGERGAIPTSASTILLRATYAIIFPKKVKQACGFWRWLKTDLRLRYSSEGTLPMTALGDPTESLRHQFEVGWVVPL